jgi:hypothetical protein
LVGIVRVSRDFLLSTLRRKLRLSVNSGIVDRDVPQDKRLYAEGWANVELTPEELVDSIKNGYPYAAQLYECYRDREHFMASDIASLDIEDGPSVSEALENPIVRAHATILYTTVRHKPEAPRFRIIFALPRTITDAREMQAVVQALRLRVAGDRNAMDPGRMYFGNRNAEVMLFDRGISPELLDELIARARTHPSLRRPRMPEIGRDGCQAARGCFSRQTGKFAWPTAGWRDFLMFSLAQHCTAPSTAMNIPVRLSSRAAAALTVSTVPPVLVPIGLKHCPRQMMCSTVLRIRPAKRLHILRPIRTIAPLPRSLDFRKTPTA